MVRAPPPTKKPSTTPYFVAALVAAFVVFVVTPLVAWGYTHGPSENLVLGIAQAAALILTTAALVFVAIWQTHRSIKAQEDAAHAARERQELRDLKASAEARIVAKLGADWRTALTELARQQNYDAVERTLASTRVPPAALELLFAGEPVADAVRGALLALKRKHLYETNYAEWERLEREDSEAMDRAIEASHQQEIARRESGDYDEEDENEGR